MRSEQQHGRRHGLYRPVQLCADLLSLGLALVLAYLIRKGAPGIPDAHDLSANLASGIWVLVLAWLVAIAYHGGYSPRLLPSGSHYYSAVLHATIYASGITGVALYLTGIPLSRVFFVVFFVLGPFFLLVNRAILRRVINRLRANGRWQIPTIVVGSMPQVDALGRTLRREAWLGYNILGAITPEGDPLRPSRLGYQSLGTDSSLIDIVRSLNPTTLVFTAGTNLDQISPGTQATTGQLPKEWHSGGHYLVVSRLQPYKHVDRVIEAFRDMPERRLLVIGKGPLGDKLRAVRPHNVKLVEGLSDAQMRWAYAHAKALIAASHEDFGLTPLEAGAHGIPTIALRAGGYLDTIDEGVNGRFFDEPEPGAIKTAVEALDDDDLTSAAVKDHAAKFREELFIEKLRSHVDALWQRGHK